MHCEVYDTLGSSLGLQPTTMDMLIMGFGLCNDPTTYSQILNYVLEVYTVHNNKRFYSRLFGIRMFLF